MSEVLTRRAILAAGLTVGSIAAASRATVDSAAATMVKGLTPLSGTPVFTIDSRVAETIELWPANRREAPLNPLVERMLERSTDPNVHDRARVGITNPRLEYLRAVNSNGAALIIIPGGGWRREVTDKEGYDIADWFTMRGIACFVLTYRLPPEGWASGADAPLADAQRAMRLVRLRAKDFGVDPKRIGVMGFSAGGHLAADLASQFTRLTYAPVDEADALSARPFVAAPIYPAILLESFQLNPNAPPDMFGPSTTLEMLRQHTPSLHIPVDAPPHFLLQAEDDPTVPVENTLALRRALVAKKIPVQTHLYEKGGHGFGIRFTKGLPLAQWPELMMAFGRAHNWIIA